MVRFELLVMMTLEIPWYVSKPCLYFYQLWGDKRSSSGSLLHFRFGNRVRGLPSVPGWSVWNWDIIAFFGCIVTTHVVVRTPH